MLTVVSMPVLYLFQGGADGGLAFAFRPSSLWDGQGWWPGLVTSMFVHNGWAHVGMNAVAALAFGPPVARRLPGLGGATAFLLFYVTCGVLATAGYGLVHPDSFAALVGASGAVFGLMGAAIRMLGRRDGRLTPLRDPRLLMTVAVIMGVNAAAGLIGLAPGGGGVSIAWEAHAFGFVAGALLIGPWTRLFGGPREAFDSAPDLRDPEA